MIAVNCYSFHAPDHILARRFRASAPNQDSYMLKRRLAANFAANTILLFSNIVTQIGTVPLFLAHWTATEYGEWLLLFSIPGYLALADAGISSIAANEASMHAAAGRTTLANRSLHSALGALLLLCSILAVVGAALCYFAPINRLLGIRLASESAVRWTVFWLIGYTLCGLAHAYYLAVYRAIDRFTRCIHLISTNRILEVVGIAVALRFSEDMTDIAAVLFGVRALIAIWMHVDLAVIGGEIRVGLERFSMDEVYRTWKLSLTSLFFPLGNALYFQGMTILVGRLAGPVAVVTLTICRILSRAIVQVVTIFKNSAVPEFAVLKGKADLARARKLNQLGVEGALAVSIGLGLAFVFFGQSIIAVWTKGAVQVSAYLVSVFVLSAVLNSVWSVMSGVVVGVNRHNRFALYYCAATLGSLILATVMVPALGVVGAAWTMVVCELFLLPIALQEICKVLELTAGNFGSSVIRFHESRLVFSELIERVTKK